MEQNCDRVVDINLLASRRLLYIGINSYWQQHRHPLTCSVSHVASWKVDRSAKQQQWSRDLTTWLSPSRRIQQTDYDTVIAGYRMMHPTRRQCIELSVYTSCNVAGRQSAVKQLVLIDVIPSVAIVLLACSAWSSDSPKPYSDSCCHAVSSLGAYWLATWTHLYPYVWFTSFTECAIVVHCLFIKLWHRR